LKAREKKAINLGFEFISSKSREISDEIVPFSSKGIAEERYFREENWTRSRKDP
jgi:hypothetical protein